MTVAVRKMLLDNCYVITAEISFNYTLVAV